MGAFNAQAAKTVAKHLALGQALAFLMSITGVSTTKLVNNNNSYSMLQSITAYLFIFMVYFPLYLYLRYKYRGTKFADYKFLQRWYKYAILAVVDLEANFCVVLAYQYTDMMSVQLLNCFTVPCVLVLSYFILKMKFAMTHILGSVVALGGLCMLISLDADGLSRNVAGGKVVLGDCLCLIASALYATSNVLTEWFIKPSKVPLLVGGSRNEAVVDLERVYEDGQTGETNHCRMALEDERNFPVDHGARNDDADEELPIAPAYVPIVENLAMMSMFALVISTVQFFIVEYKTLRANRTNWGGEDWLFQIVFGLTMLFVYTGMPILFVVTSAAFANVSLLTANVYAILWNVTIFHIYPTKIFFVAYAIIVVGILLYNLTDVVRIPFCTRINYPCGEVVVEAEETQRNRDDQYKFEDRYFGTRE